MTFWQTRRTHIQVTPLFRARLNADPSLHPTLDTLQAYSLGKLDDGGAEFVRKHLAGSYDCRQQVKPRQVIHDPGRQVRSVTLRPDG